MKISIPSIPEKATRRAVHYPIDTAAHLVADFMQSIKGRALVMTGAGASVDSGIAPYRGENGHYTVHKTYRPIFYHEFVDPSPKGHVARQRYWSRSFLGYPPVMHALPNKTHYSIAAMQRLGYFENYITQNVDNLHHAATPSASLAASTILELHGTLQAVVCVSRPSDYPDPADASSPSHPHLHAPPSAPPNSNPTTTPPPPRDAHRHSLLTSHSASWARPREHNTPTGEAYPRGCGFRGSRTALQALLAERNPRWQALAEDMRLRRAEPKTNPDGDVDLGNADYSSFQYEPCPQCGGILKPSVVFFGENVPAKLKARSYELLDRAEGMLLVGTSLATYSAYRLVRDAVERGLRVLLLNMGPTRADALLLPEQDAATTQTVLTTAPADASPRPRPSSAVASCSTAAPSPPTPPTPPPPSSAAQPPSAPPRASTDEPPPGWSPRAAAAAAASPTPTPALARVDKIEAPCSAVLGRAAHVLAGGAPRAYGGVSLVGAGFDAGEKGTGTGTPRVEGASAGGGGGVAGAASRRGSTAATMASRDPVLARLLTSGVEVPPKERMRGVVSS